MATAQSSTQVLRFPALPTGRLWKRVTVKRALAGHTLYRLGVLITLCWVAVALLAPWIVPYSPPRVRLPWPRAAPHCPTFSAWISMDAISSHASSTGAAMTCVLL